MHLPMALMMALRIMYASFLLLLPLLLQDAAAAAAAPEGPPPAAADAAAADAVDGAVGDKRTEVRPAAV